MESSVATERLSCHECGRTITPDAVLCDGCHAPVVRRYCPRCSELVPENTAFCPYCKASAKDQRRQILNFPIAPVVVIGTVILALFLLTRGESDKTADVAKTTVPEERVAALQAGGIATVLPRKAQFPVITTGGAINPDTGASSTDGLHLNLQGHKLLREGKCEQAIPIFHQAVKSFPEGSDSAKYALYNLGYCLRQTGKNSEAIPILEQCVRLDQKWQKARDELEIAKASNS